MIDIKSLKRIHFIGVGGIGISYLAHYFLRQGAVVSGSDLAQTQVTDQLAARGAILFQGHDAENVPQDADLVVANDAVPADNQERLKAAELKIPVMSNFELVGLISENYQTIAVAGNKGKTTTSAMIAIILEAAGCDPTGMIGSIVNEWKCNFRQGQSDYLVIEADEYKEHFLQIKTNKAVITNMAADHLDYFGDEQGVIDAFQKFVDQLPANGTLIINQDDELIKKLQRPNCNIITFGINNTADIVAEDFETINNRQFFSVRHHHNELGRFSLVFPGKFNVYNALAAIGTCLDLGVGIKKVQQGLADFKGTWRRFQIIGPYKGATVISDYAHHPVAVHGTLEAAQDFYSGQRLVAVFQSHTRHRTKSLFKDFVASLDPADVIIIPEIFEVSGREVMPQEEMNSQMLVDAIKERDSQHGRERIVLNGGDLSQTKVLIDKHVQAKDILLFMGAGNIYQLAESLI